MVEYLCYVVVKRLIKFLFIIIGNVDNVFVLFVVLGGKFGNQCYNSVYCLLLVVFGKVL